MSGRVPPGGEPAVYTVHAMPHKTGRHICLRCAQVHDQCQPRRSSGGQAEVPNLEPQIEFSVGIFSHERGKHLNFTVRRSGAILPRNPPRTFHQLLLFCSVASPAPPVLAARESHDPRLLSCAGMAVNIHPVHLDHAEQLLGAPGAPAVRSGWAGCCGRLSRWVVLARGELSRDEFSTSDDDHGVFGQLHLMNVLVVHGSTGLWFARVRAASRCVLERLSWHHRDGA